MSLTDYLQLPIDLHSKYMSLSCGRDGEGLREKSHLEPQELPSQGLAAFIIPPCVILKLLWHWNMRGLINGSTNNLHMQ